MNATRENMTERGVEGKCGSKERSDLMQTLPDTKRQVPCCGSVENMLFNIAIICMSLGLAVMSIGYIIPRDLVFDPSLPARQMEAIELRYAKLSYHLDLCIITGMGIIVFGGVIASSMTVYYYVTDGQSHSKSSETELLTDNKDFMATYGSRGS